MPVTPTHKTLRQLDMVLQVYRYVCQLSAAEGVPRDQWAGRRDFRDEDHSLLSIMRRAKAYVQYGYATPYGTIDVVYSNGWRILVGAAEDLPPRTPSLWQQRMSVKGEWSFNTVQGDLDELFDTVWDAFQAIKRLDIAHRLAPPLVKRRERTETEQKTTPAQQSLPGIPA